MNATMITVIGIAQIILDIVWWVIVVQVVLSWLFAFNVLNTSSQGVRTVAVAIDRITAPLYRPIRRILPDFGGIDFSPLVILLVIALLNARVLEPLKQSYQLAG
ncbi:MAG: YggT family protein [Pseudomonadota bacterium]